MSGIFLSYRRDDTAGYSGRLADDLRDNLRDSVVFRDVDGIAPGVDFVGAITSAIENADVLLVVIGRRWLTAKAAGGRRRIDDPDDYVGIEITIALQLGRRIIPVLVDGARLPRANELPEPIRPMLRHNAIELTDSRWRYDIGLLVDQLRPTEVLPVVAAPAPGKVAPTPRRVRRRRWALAVVGVLLVTGLIAPLTLSGHGSPTLAGSLGESSTTAGPEASSTSSPTSSSAPDTSTTTVATPPPSSGPPATPAPVQEIPQPTSPRTPPPTSAQPNPTPLPTQPDPMPPPVVVVPQPVTVQQAPPPTTTTTTTTAAPAPPYYPYEKRSADGAFGDYKTPDGNHYIVRRVATGALVFTTRPQYVGDAGDAVNDVKDAAFCSSGVFAATYHYSDETNGGIYSWIGKWSLASGAFVGEQRVPGELYTVGAYC